jgi:phosphoribosylformylglycinamidine synthase
MRFSIVIFPGSNCDRDCAYVLESVFQQDVSFVFHKEKRLPATDCVILPGGFSYGDYLRSGAIARFSPIMEDVIRFGKSGGLVLGICNGFQIMLEASLLPGAMRINKNGRFICRDVFIKVENPDTPFTYLCRLEGKEVLKIPIAHREGNYFAPPDVLEDMKKHGQIIFRYCDRHGTVTEESNPNGSLEGIAGISNKEKNCLGMMPHPERASESLLGSEDGALLFRSLIAYLSGRRL